MVRVLEFNFEDPGFNPLAGHGDRQFFYPSESTLVQTCVVTVHKGYTEESTIFEFKKKKIMFVFI